MIELLILSAALSGGQPAATPTKPKKEAKICRTIEVTGTRMGNRTECKSADDWKLERDQAQQVLNGRRDLVDGHPVDMVVRPLPQ